MRNFIGEMFSTFVSQGLPRELVEQLRPWASTFGTNVLQRWGPIVAERAACAHVSRAGNACPSLAVCECRACGEQMCLGHAYVRKDASAICADCVAAFASAARSDEREAKAPRAGKKGRGKGRGAGRRWEPPPPPPPPPPDDTAQALQILGLGPAASWEEVVTRFRQLSREHHPDRFTDPARKAEAERMFKRITEAYHHLERTRTAA